MRETRFMMGMPVTVEVVGDNDAAAHMRAVFDYFIEIDNRFSTYKAESEISAINYHGLPENEWSADMKEVFRCAEETKQASDGYFDIRTKAGTYDPSGIVKGWAIWKAGIMLAARGAKDHFIDAGGDIQVAGKNSEGKKWRVGIRDPFGKGKERDRVVKVVEVTDEGVATSGTYIRGQHIYDPHRRDEPLTDIVSLTVIGPNIYEADRFATAAFAMGRQGIEFIERQKELEGYMIDAGGMATMTSGFGKYVAKDLQ